jgi:hypothetical protein
MAFSVALPAFWRIRGEVQPSETVAPGQDEHGSGLRDRSADFERSWKLTTSSPLNGTGRLELGRWQDRRSLHDS